MIVSIEAVERYNAEPGLPLPEDGAAAGYIKSIQSANSLTIDGRSFMLFDVDSPAEDDPEFDEARQALMRLCPVDTLMIYEERRATIIILWCYGYPLVPPLSTANQIMNEADYDIIGKNCDVPHEGRLLGCSR